MSKVVKASSYGKIYIAGEYAVVSGGYAIIFPVSKKLNIILSESDYYYLYSHKYHNSFQLLNFNNPNNLYITKTINLFNQFLKELNIKEERLKIEIISELDSDNNQKYGLGSSACIIVTLLKALFTYYNISFSSITIYKFACIIQAMINKNTSYGDLACIAFGKKILYKKFDEKVINSFFNLKISDILKMDFPGLVIKEIDLNFNYLLIYTFKDVNSYELVEKVLKVKDTTFFKNFKLQSDTLVEDIVKTNDILIFKKLNDLLKELARFSETKLFTKEMEELEDIIIKNGGIMKFSGAGGGDCVLGFFKRFIDLEKTKEKLIKLGYNIL